MSKLFSEHSDNSRGAWISEPTATNLIWVVLLWFVGNSLSVIAMTDLFRESLFQSRFALLYFIMISSTIVMLVVVINYFRNKTNH
ncbi:hypothetical protein [Penaeicola halotolerans]|uniref:hypothetical protein n=1 Tax=Penaeicola halotolerans TaxID=2793196 RepID=UPI001CF842EC|nr:hypothetical protein [Penaeicola halotolerans]